MVAATQAGTLNTLISFVPFSTNYEIHNVVSDTRRSCYEEAQVFVCCSTVRLWKWYGKCVERQISANLVPKLHNIIIWSVPAFTFQFDKNIMSSWHTEPLCIVWWPISVSMMIRWRIVLCSKNWTFLIIPRTYDFGLLLIEHSTNVTLQRRHNSAQCQTIINLKTRVHAIFTLQSLNL